MVPALVLHLLGSAVLGISVTAILTLVVRTAARRYGPVDRPTQTRNVHQKAMPTGGGIALAGGVVAALGSFYVARGGLPGAMQTTPFWLGAFLMLGAGFWDDKYDIDAKSKFFLQLIAAYLLLHGGVYLGSARFSYAGISEFDWALYSIPLLMVWVVGVINAVNLVDGLDGLATGLIAIAFLACAAVFGIIGELELMAVGIVITCALIGFLPFNFNPASIFMGDSGSLFIGYLIAAYTIQLPLHSGSVLSILILPVLLGVPLLDTGAAIVRRLGSDRTIFAPDRRHIHHRLIETGSVRTAVVSLYFVGAWFGGAALLMEILPSSWGYALAGGTAISVIVWAWHLGCFTSVSSENEPTAWPAPAVDETILGTVPVNGTGGNGASNQPVRVPVNGEISDKGQKTEVLSVVGARPNFMKVAPLHRALSQHERFRSTIVHTGQHYDEKMSDVFFEQLELPRPDVYLGVGSGSHAQQTARVMTAFEEVIEERQPDLVITVGDVNSTLASALVATKCHIPVAHVEAGLRSGDRRMPEEINRMVTDRIADYLFVTEQSGVDHLQQEGLEDDKIYFVGNLMIDSLVQFREKAAGTSIVEDLGVDEGHYVLMTMHRPSNVDNEAGVRKLLHIIEELAANQPVVFPMHPRTRNRFGEFGLEETLTSVPSLRLLEPLGYLEFLRLMDKAGVVVTDSGGIQEETTFLGVPCLTLREHTERPVTIDLGTNELLSLDPSRVIQRVRTLIGTEPETQQPPYWDGRTAERIVRVLEGTPLASPVLAG